MSIFRPEYRPKEPPKNNNGRETTKPDRTDILALIIAAFQVLTPYLLFMIVSVVLVAVLLLKVWVK